MGLQNFIDDPDAVDLTDPVHSILETPEALTNEQVSALLRALVPFSGTTIEYGADFDMKEIIQEQLQLVRAMRNSVLTEEGHRLPGVTARDLKEVVSASTTLTTTLMKSHEKIMNYDRQRAIEEATVAAIRKLPEEAQGAFFTVLEEKLGEIR